MLGGLNELICVTHLVPNIRWFYINGGSNVVSSVVTEEAEHNPRFPHHLTNIGEMHVVWQSSIRYFCLYTPCLPKHDREALWE